MLFFTDSGGGGIRTPEGCKPLLVFKTSAFSQTLPPLQVRMNMPLKSGCGERGIRTLETRKRLHAFQACAFSHSATSPDKAIYFFNPLLVNLQDLIKLELQLVHQK